MDKIRVILVDDHEMVRLGLKSFLNMQKDIEVIGEASNGRQGIDLALELRPDVLVMDLVMPEMGGVEATLDILSKWTEAKVLVLTSYLDNEKIYPVIDAGAKGYMLKTSSAAEILNAIKKVAKEKGFNYVIDATLGSGLLVADGTDLLADVKKSLGF